MRGRLETSIIHPRCCCSICTKESSNQIDILRLQHILKEHRQVAGGHGWASAHLPNLCIDTTFEAATPLSCRLAHHKPGLVQPHSYYQTCILHIPPTKLEWSCRKPLWKFQGSFNTPVRRDHDLLTVNGLCLPENEGQPCTELTSYEP